MLLKENSNAITAFNTLITVIDYYMALCEKLRDEEWCIPFICKLRNGKKKDSKYANGGLNDEELENEKNVSSKLIDDDKNYNFIVERSLNPSNESMNDDNKNYNFIAEGAFHPLVNNFIKNDIKFNFGILTGPNTAGKSTYLKTIAIITILGQMGSPVPARNAVFKVRDGIFIRSGASDRYGISTFMREMKGIARITNMCTSDSLVLIDELGRGTSYIDGISLSIAIKEYLYSKGALTLFATHFTSKNERIFLSGDVELLCSKLLDGVITYKVKKGVSNSYGSDVTKKVTFPNDVIVRAEEYMNE